MRAAVPRQTWGVTPIPKPRLRIGLSFDQGTPKYGLYLGALMAAAETYQHPVEGIWLAGKDLALNREAARSIDGLILTGGADVEPARYGRIGSAELCTTFPGRDEIELAILEAATSRRIPVLAICRGMQLLNVARGGTLNPEIGRQQTHQLPDEERHPVLIEKSTALHQIVHAEIGHAGSSHHQAVDKLGDGLRVSARHPDGTIEAIEWTDPMRRGWLVGIQWHPERMGMGEALAGSLFRTFLEAANVRRL